MDFAKLLLFAVLVNISATMPSRRSALPNADNQCKLRKQSVRLGDVNWSRVFGRPVGYLLHENRTIDVSYCSGSCNYADDREYLYRKHNDALTRAILLHSCKRGSLGCRLLKAMGPCCVPERYRHRSHSDDDQLTIPLPMKLKEHHETINFVVRDKKGGLLRQQLKFTFSEPKGCMCS